MTGLDSLKVEVAFANDPDDGPTLTWTDITNDVRTVETSRGKSRELDTFPPGQCTITLQNENGSYDPAWTAGPYHAGLVPSKPVRVSMLDSGSTRRNLFAGFVQSLNGWQLTYGPTLTTGRLSTSEARLSAYDWLGRAAQMTMRASTTTGDYTGGFLLVALAAAGVTLPGWQSVVYDLGQVLQSDVTFDGTTSVADFLDATMIAEGGDYFVDRNGALTFIDKYGPIQQSRMNTSQRTFAAPASGSQVPVAVDDGIVRSFADFYLTDVTFANAAGYSYRAHSAGSDLQRYSQTGLTIERDADVEARASFVYSMFHSPQWFANGLRIKPRRSTYALDAALQSELRDLVTVTLTAQRISAGTPASTTVTETAFVNSIAHRIDVRAGDWDTTFGFGSADRYNSVAGANTAGVWDTGKWDTATWGW